MPPWNTSNRTKSRSRHTARLNLSNSPAQNTAKTLFIGACCGNGDKLLDTLDEGLDHFAGLIRKHMLDYEDVSKDLLCTLWESQSDIPPYIERQMETAVQIINSITSKVAVDSRTSIDDIVDQIFDQFDVSTTDRNLHEDVMRHLVFAVIGWSTMLYIPMFRSAGDNFCTASGSRSTDYQTRQSLTESSQRPLGAMLRSHGLMPITCLPESGPSLGLPTLLPVTHLNFFSLSRLGDVSIIWVDELSKHCEFDRYSARKELHLFRLPSLCAKICLDESSKVLIGRLFKCNNSQHECYLDPDTVGRSYLIEVLLSYRLLFGQHSGSRKLFHERERHNAKQHGALDPLLNALCGSKELDGFGDTKELLRERGVYNALTNFPHLGARLMELEDYSTIQRPRNMTEIWNDERDPERLLTFKALVIVGGISIFLSLLQVFLAIAQVVLAAVL